MALFSVVAPNYFEAAACQEPFSISIEGSSYRESTVSLRLL